jgi:hypothetical protein
MSKIKLEVGDEVLVKSLGIIGKIDHLRRGADTPEEDHIVRVSFSQYVRVSDLEYQETQEEFSSRRRAELNEAQARLEEAQALLQSYSEQGLTPPLTVIAEFFEAASSFSVARGGKPFLVPIKQS